MAAMYGRLGLVALVCAAAAHVPAASLAAEPPYEAKLVRLAEVLGSVHFLRNLCGEQGNAWRDSMSKLLETEKPDEERKAKLTAAFNHGYRAYESVYLRCTPQAVSAINLYMKEGESLADDIASRYGN